MEDLIDSFATSQVTVQHNTTAAEHPHFSLFKAKSTSSSQEARRKKFLDHQKNKRFDYANHARNLASNEFNDEPKDEEEEDMLCEIAKPPRSYRNQLMLSEWLVEVPYDLHEEWLLVLCPVGKRSLVVASRGGTKVYTKSGYQVNNFQSKIPGGNRCTSASQGAYSLLDCIFSEVDKTYYVLDVMCWNSHPCFDSETEFRFYWIDTKFEETPDAGTISKQNPYKFLPVPHFSCTKESIRKAVWDPLPFPSNLDGLLFYHKRTHYTHGTTPLVCWLKGYMLPEMLGVDVPAYLEAERPATYTNMQNHCPEAYETHRKRKEEEERRMQVTD